MSPCHSTLHLLTLILQYKSILIGFQFKRFYIYFRNVSIANKVLFFMLDFKIKRYLCGFVVSFLSVAIFVIPT